MKVGIIGCGFIGTALKNWLEENNTEVEIRVSDPPKDNIGCIPTSDWLIE